MIAAQPTVGIKNFETVDLDGDGDLDLLTASPGDNRIGWSENIGNGEFIPRKDISQSSTGAYDATASDLDGDGYLDVIAASQAGNKISWFKHYGRGLFGYEEVVDATANGATSVVGMDMDGDGDLDIVAACQSSGSGFEIRWYENLGGTFRAHRLLPGNASTQITLLTLDIDNDGDDDLISQGLFSGSHIIRLHENVNGAIALPRSLVSRSSAYSSFDFADINGDSLLDIVLPLGGDVLWARNNGSNTFRTLSRITSQFIAPQAISCADIDGDGDQDIVGIDPSVNVIEISWVENTGGTNFTTKHLVQSRLRLGSNTLYKVSAINIDGSNGVDIIWSDSDFDFIEVFRDSTVGSFHAPVKVTGDFGLSNSILVDVNNDGLDDVVMIGPAPDRYIKWSENLGRKEFGPIQNIIPKIQVFGFLQAGDINSDNFEDIIYFTSQPTGRAYWLSNNKNGTFGTPQRIGSSNNISSIELEDYDHDGDKDMLISPQGYVFENTGGGQYTSVGTVSSLGGNSNASIFTNLTNDTLVDIVVVGDRNMVWWINQGGSFSSGRVFQNDFKMVDAGDVDGDGDEDLVYALSNDEIYYLDNLRGFTGFARLLTNQVNSIQTLKLSDLDADGDLDVLTVSSADYKVAWHENVNGKLSAQKVLNIQSTNYNPISATVGDLDDDGVNDILLTTRTPSTYAGKISIFSNGSRSPFQARGTVFVDENQNGMLDPNEPRFNQAPIATTPNIGLAYSGVDGNYFMNFDVTVPFTYQISPIGLPNWGITSDSLSYDLPVDSTLFIADSLDFGMYPIIRSDSTRSDLVGSFSRCNTVINSWINVTNTGTTFPSGIIQLRLDPKISFVSSSVMPDSIVGQDVYWHFDSLFYFENQMIKYEAAMPDFRSIGDTLKSRVVTRLVDSLGTTTFSSYDSLYQVLLCAYDPNDKLAEPSVVGSQGYLPYTTEYIDYTVRFQNTGNDTAFVVIIEDQLDPNLEWTSILPLASSHPMEFDFLPNGLVSFIFNDIQLPDSGANFNGSQGFVKFRINLNQGLPAGTEIRNSAGIFFDQNPPIITNTTLHTLFDCANLSANVDQQSICFGDVLTGDVPLYLDSTQNTWRINSILNTSTERLAWVADTAGIFDLNLLANSRICRLDTTIRIEVYPALDTSVTLNRSNLTSNAPAATYQWLDCNANYAAIPGATRQTFEPTANGIYAVQLTENSCVDTSACYSITTVSIDDVTSYNIHIYPSPFSEQLNIDLSDVKQRVRVAIHDLQGRTVYHEVKEAGNNVLLNLEKLTPGHYTILLYSDSQRLIHSARVIKQ
ncbi:MAG: FG-GAP-like repeat-containing protein [Bacteroidota bacterium]